MSHTKLFTLVILLLFSHYLFAQPEIIWQLVDGNLLRWVYVGGDEFNDNDLNVGKWAYHYPWGANYQGPYKSQAINTNGNNYSFEYNSEIQSGTLKLLAKHEDLYARGIDYESDNYVLPDGTNNLQMWHYTTGMIFSKERFKEGLFEINAKWPVGSGFYPAFWLYGGHPNEEIDAIEYGGNHPNQYHIDMHCPNGCENYFDIFTQFFNWLNHEPGSDYGGWVTLNGNLNESFNVIRAEWDNGAVYFSINQDEFAIWLGTLQYSANIIANNNVAGPVTVDWAGLPNSTTPWPGVLEMDYIRAYSRLNCDNDITINPYYASDQDYTVRTGRNMYCANINIPLDRNLNLIATEMIDILPETDIQGVFDGHVIKCPQWIEHDVITQQSDSIKLHTINNQTNLPYSLLKRKTAGKPIGLEIKISPNPCSTTLDIDLTGSINHDIIIELYSPQGIKVFSKPYTALGTYHIDVSSYSNGVYIIKGVYYSGSVVMKLVIKK